MSSQLIEHMNEDSGKSPFDVLANVEHYEVVSRTGQQDQNGTLDAGPLTGLRVVDLSTSYAGPTASMYLADLGADVIKVERPGSGDETRLWGPPFVDESSAWFASANRNKRSVVVNLRSEGGQRVLDRLLADADVFLENLNPAKLAALGIDYETVHARHPRLIYCALSGFGLTGPDSSTPGYDLAAQARSGMMSVTGSKGGSPQRVSTAVSDVVTAMCAVLAINAAVVRQHREGVGDLIDVSLLDSDLALMAPRIAAYLAGEPEPAPSGGTDSVLAVYQTFSAADRDVVVAIGNDSMWQRFCAALELTDLGADERLKDNEGRRRHRPEIIAEVSDRMRQRESQEWLRILGESGIPCSLVRSLSEVVSDPHVQDRGSLLPVPGAGSRLFGVHSPFRLRSVPEPPNSRFPDLGADTLTVLTEQGFTSEEIDDLFAEGAVRGATTPDDRSA